jgi:hypothetical protein
LIPLLPTRNSQAVTAAKVMRATGCVGAKLHLDYEGCWIATTMSRPYVLPPILKAPSIFSS